MSSRSFPRAKEAVLVEDLRQLHALSLRLASNDDVSVVLADVLRSTAAFVSAPLGSIQLLTAEGALGMVGQIVLAILLTSNFLPSV
jgi:hypothetical protein